MKKVATLIVVGMTLAQSQSAAELVVNCDFSHCPVLVENAPGATQRKGSFRGVLPEGWRDDFSGWNASRAA